MLACGTDGGYSVLLHVGKAYGSAPRRQPVTTENVHSMGGEIQVSFGGGGGVWHPHFLCSAGTGSLRNSRTDGGDRKPATLAPGRVEDCRGERGGGPL